MGRYLDGFKKNLEAQSEKSVLYLRNELSSFYGMTNFLKHFDTLGSSAVARSNIHRGKKKKHMMVMSFIGKVNNSLLHIFNDSNFDKNYKKPNRSEIESRKY